MKIDRKARVRLKKYLIKKIQEDERSHVRVETPYKLSSEARKLFYLNFADLKNYSVDFAINPEILGGFIIKSGSLIIDASLQRKIDGIVAKLK